MVAYFSTIIEKKMKAALKMKLCIKNDIEFTFYFIFPFLKYFDFQIC